MFGGVCIGFLVLWKIGYFLFGFENKGIILVLVLMLEYDWYENVFVGK